MGRFCQDYNIKKSAAGVFFLITVFCAGTAGAAAETGWESSRWFGWYYRTESAWLWHPAHGWLYPAEGPDGRLLGFDHGLGAWLYSDEAVCPFFYKYGWDQGWMWYSGGAAPERLFYHYGSAPRWLAEADAAIGEKAERLLSEMSLEEKAGQMTLPRWKDVTSDEITAFGFGALLHGPGDSPDLSPEEWADLNDGFQQAALDSRLGIPAFIATDAVHGHNNAFGAVIFPHNIGLGAARDADLLFRIGRGVAWEMAATGVNWTLAPCVAAARDPRWGRTYESFGEHPEIHDQLAAPYIRALQQPLSGNKAMTACAKHYLADGGTTWGTGDNYPIDQGDAQMNEARLRAIHLPPYRQAVAAGVGSVMASFSSWNGQKMHGHAYLLTEVLKEELGFEGFVVSDAGGIWHLSADARTCVKESINAGIDMAMTGDQWQVFYENLISLAENGEIPLSRIDDAVRRILRAKLRAGLFDHPLAAMDIPASEAFGGESHRTAARESVRKSLVLLKNDGLLPLSKDGNYVVAGAKADDLGSQCGGWTLTWMGETGNVIPGTNILEGIENAVSAKGSVTYDRAAFQLAGYDAAIAVIGELPYAEGRGDDEDLALNPGDVRLLEKIEAAGLPAVVILLSGRPLMITSVIDSCEAFVAAWLPGSEGDGVADVLFGDYDFTGHLPVTWPRSADQLPINAGDPGYDPLFPYGFGLRYAP